MADTNQTPCVSTSWNYCFSSNYPTLDGQWNGIVSASDGKTYFGVSAHSTGNHAKFFSFDPKAKKVDYLGDMGEVCGENDSSSTPQGKIHAPMFEIDGVIYFGTMHGIYTEEATSNYPGGHFCSYNIKTGKFKDYGIARPGEAIVTMVYDSVYDRFYGICWKGHHDGGSGKNHCVMLDRKTGKITDLGPFEPEGRAARWLLADPKGNIYGTCTGGKIWKFDPAKGKQEFLNVTLPVAPYAKDADIASDKLAPFNTMRLAVWDDKTQSFYVLVHVSELLFRFDPATMKMQPLGDFGIRDSDKRPASLGVCKLGRRIYYTPWPKARVVNLKSYDIDTGKFVNHGTIHVGPREAVELHSICAGSDGNIHGVAFVYAAEGDKIVDRKEKKGGKPFGMYFIVIDPEKDFHGTE